MHDDQDAQDDRDHAGDEAIHALFEGAPFMLFASEGPEHLVRAANGPLRAMFGDRAYGKPLREAFRDLAHQKVYEVYDEAFRSRQPKELVEWRVDIETPEGPTEIVINSFIWPWLRDDGEIRGLLTVGQVVTESVRAREAAEQARAVAQEALAEARSMVVTMQSAHLPDALPVLPRLDVAARYLLAADDTASGGDWFDAVVRPDGTVALVVGDVVGHGTAASATMGQLRAVVHERLSSASGLAEVVADVDRFARTSTAARAATLCIVVLDPVTGRGHYVTAGHPPPLVLDGDLRYLEPTGGGPLATNGPAPVLPFHLDAPDALVVLYTDGILERPGTTPSGSTVELATTVDDAAHGRGKVLGAPVRLTERVCENTIELMTRTNGYSDDITVLAAQRVPAPERLTAEWTARPAALADARFRISDWLDDLHVRPVERISALHAATELLANAATHAYVDHATPGPMRLSLELEEIGDLRITVEDDGAWRVPDADSSHNGGRGLSMTSGLLDSIDVDGTPEGTTAVGTMRLPRPARLQSAPPATRLRPTTEAPFAVVEEPDRLVVSGAVLQVEADELDGVLRRTSRAGTVPTVVDLTDVTHLGSAGVQALFQAVGDGGVTLHAPNGTVAQHALDLVNLPHDR